MVRFLPQIITWNQSRPDLSRFTQTFSRPWSRRVWIGLPQLVTNNLYLKTVFKQKQYHSKFLVITKSLLWTQISILAHFWTISTKSGTLRKRDFQPWLFTCPHISWWLYEQMRKNNEHFLWYIRCMPWTLDHSSEAPPAGYVWCVGCWSCFGLSFFQVLFYAYWKVEANHLPFNMMNPAEEGHLSQI